jgi:hypothetical protein
LNPTNPYESIDLGTLGFKPEQPGEKITLVVSEVKQVETKAGKLGVAVVGSTSDGREYDWVAWNRTNKAEVARERPLIGDTLEIRYTGRDPQAENEAMAARWFTLKVLRRAGVDDEIVTSPDEPPAGLFDDAEPELDDEAA